MALLRAKNTATASATTAITVTTPTCVAGDMLFFIIAGDGANSFPQTAPTGWVATDSSSLGDHSDVYVYHRVATGTEAASYTFTANGPNQKLCAQMLSYIGPTAFQRASTKSNPSSTLSAPPTAHTSTATTANAIGNMLLAVLVTTSTGTQSTPASSNIATSWTPASGFTDQGIVTNGTSLSLEVADGTATSTTVGASTFTSNNATDGQFIMLVYTDTSQTVRPTGLAATGTLGSFSVVNGSNNSVNVTGVRGVTGLGTLKYEADYGATFDGTVANLVRVGATGLAATGYPAGTLPRTTYISAGVIDPIPEGFPAFQPNAFQTDAYQVIRYAHASQVTATGAVGSVIYEAAYAPLGYTSSFGGAGMLGVVGTLQQYHVDYAVTGVAGTGAVGDVIYQAGYLVTGLSGTGTLGTVAVHFDCIFTLPGGIYYLRPMAGHLGVPNVTYDKVITVTGLYATSVLGAFDPQVRYAVVGVVGTTHLGAVDPQVRYRVVGVAGTGLLGHFVAGWVQQAPVTGVQATGQLNPPTVVNPNTFVGMSVEGTGGVGQVAFQIDSSPTIAGVVGQGQLGVPAIRVDASTAPAGLQASSALGHATAMNMPRLQASGAGQIGAVSFRIDCNVQPLGIFATGQVGTLGERRDVQVSAPSVQGTGQIGTTAALPQSAFDKHTQLYVRLQ